MTEVFLYCKKPNLIIILPKTLNIVVILVSKARRKSKCYKLIFIYDKYYSDENKTVQNEYQIDIN